MTNYTLAIEYYFRDKAKSKWKDLTGKDFSGEDAWLLKYAENSKVKQLSGPCTATDWDKRIWAGRTWMNADPASKHFEVKRRRGYQVVIGTLK